MPTKGTGDVGLSIYRRLGSESDPTNDEKAEVYIDGTGTAATEIRSDGFGA
jgi:hypothetical protein